MKTNMETSAGKSAYITAVTLVDAGYRDGILESSDRIYAYNRLLARLGLDGSIQPSFGLDQKSKSVYDCVQELIIYAIGKGMIDDVFDHREIFAAELIDCLMARPSEINRYFYQLHSISPARATDWFYQFCKNVQYIQVARISKNVSYKAACEYGELDITINLSKPEKNPADIAAERNMIRSDYPRCLLCVENEGYKGRVGHPARANHRLISMQELAGEQWFFQYSPYSYYNEHCIVLSDEHRPMKIDRNTFVRITSFLDRFPHYFIGSNADLPIVGGSILSHDHYQGGRFSFAMDRAPVEEYFCLKSYPGIKAGTVKWPMSVIRLSSTNKSELIECSAAVLSHWREYNDVKADIKANTGVEPHNTITPIGRKRGDEYEIDLVLRNNRCTAEHPLGLFHPHEDVHHIKKENIGLIEVMGLAVLPARLVDELAQVANILSGGKSEPLSIHLPWTEELVQKYGSSNSSEDSAEIVRRETAIKFERVLADAGVFKRDVSGRKAFARYIGDLAASI